MIGVTSAQRTAADPGARSRQALRRLRRRRRDRLRPPARRGVRLPRPERGGEDVDDAHDRLRLARHGRHAARLRPRSRARRRRRSAGGSASCPQQDTLDMELTVRENIVIYGRYFGLPAQAARRAGRRAPRLRRAHRARERQGRAALGRDEAPAHDRALARQRPRGHAARRADDRPRPAGAARRLGSPLPPEAAGRDARPDDALHGRGRAALRPARRHGPREDRRRGLAARAHRALLDARGRRAPLRRREPPRRPRATGRTASSSRVESLPIACSCTRTTATPPSHGLHERGLVPESVLVRRSTLEDVFLHLTGRSLIE